MYISSLAHVLSISGYHMAVVAGIVFFVIRARPRSAAARWRAAVRSRNGRRVGALLAAAFFYLLLSGSEVATQRSFIMIAIVLIGVMLDRPALTFRTLSGRGALRAAAGAAVGRASELPDVVCGDARADRGLPARPAVAAPTPTPRCGARIALWGGREIAGLMLASLVAGLATTPYAAFHFHRLAPYGVIANLLAMPVVSAG